MPDRPHALVVDDSLDWLDRAAAAIAELGYTVETAVGAREAGQRIGAMSFELIVTDNAMETPDAGIGLLMGLQALGRPVPAILYSSAYSDEQRAFLARQLPTVFVVQKQQTPGAPELVAAVRALTGGARTPS